MAPLGLNAVRYGIPLALLIAGVVVEVVGEGHASEGAAIVLMGLAGLMVLSTVLFRAGLASNEEREGEEGARRFFDEHGRWPGRGEPGGPRPRA